MATIARNPASAGAPLHSQGFMATPRHQRVQIVGRAVLRGAGLHLAIRAERLDTLRHIAPLGDPGQVVFDQRVGRRGHQHVRLRKRVGSDASVVEMV